jgi:hypothetical protein
MTGKEGGSTPTLFVLDPRKSVMNELRQRDVPERCSLDHERIKVQRERDHLIF